MIKNPNKTAVKLFLVPYDLSDMEAGQKTFIRQRSYSAGPIIDMPLKAKLSRIDPGVKVFRCKVQTPPGKQFEVRSAAYRRIEATLKENGIEFADPGPRVMVYPGMSPGPAGREDRAIAK